jgi:hypothetical protein
VKKITIKDFQRRLRFEITDRATIAELNRITNIIDRMEATATLASGRRLQHHGGDLRWRRGDIRQAPRDAQQLRYDRPLDRSDRNLIHASVESYG